MPPRLVIVADPKMLPALSSGLRDGNRFDVYPVSLADPAAVQAAAAEADAVALFYGAPTAPLPAALQALAPKVRDRGGRLVAVLQREQAAHRDACFRAGASDLLFMPMPREQFVARLAGSVGLSFAPDAAAHATVAVATRTASSKLERALVSPSGVEANSQLPLKPGETVRLSFGTFQIWGLVVRGGPPTQIRFAGLAPDEEAKIGEWVKSGAPQAAAQPQPSTAPAPVAPPQFPAAAAPAPAAQPAPGPAPARGAPVAGPPPGFVDRKSPRARQPATPPAGSKRMTPPPPPSGATATPDPAPRPPAAANGNASPLAELFDKVEGAAPAPPAPQQPQPPLPKGPPWPAPIAIALCKTAAMKVIADQDPGPEVPANVAASARKIAALLSAGERDSIAKTGADSYFADVFAARVALDAATAEGNRLSVAKPSPVVDAEALTALTKAADEAAASLQKEANAAIAKGELEMLQLVTAASAALSRDLLNVKETADRLRGVGSAPRLGAGSLDPEVVLPGQQPRPRPPPGQQAPPPVKAELRDFRGLEERPGRGKGILAVVAIAAAIAVAAHAFYFNAPRHVSLSADVAGRGVQRIEISGNSAVVTVTPEWVADADANLPKLVQVLKSRQVAKAILTLPTGKPAGVVNVVSGRASGLPQPPKPPPLP